MTSSRLETLSFCLQNVLADKLVSMSAQLGELTASVPAGDLLQVMEKLGMPISGKQRGYFLRG